MVSRGNREVNEERRNIALKFRVLGCSGGQLPGYNLSSFLIDDSLLIDAGSTTAALTLAAQQKIRDILVTHIHLDHVMALGTLADNLYGKCKVPINVWSVRRVIDGLAKSFFNNQVWPDFTRITGPTQRVPVLRLLSLREGKVTTIGGHFITAIGVGHVVPTVAFLVESKNRHLASCRRHRTYGKDLVLRQKTPRSRLARDRNFFPEPAPGRCRREPSFNTSNFASGTRQAGDEIAANSNYSP